jgi:hypothetical protein
VKTISRRATRQIAAIKERATVCVVRDLRYNFEPKPCEPAYAWEQLDRYSSARLWQEGDGESGDRWKIRIHGNLWYELREPAPAKEA